MGRRTLLVAAAGAMAVLLIWYLFLWSPTGSNLAKARKDADKAQQDRASLQDQLSRLRSSRRQEPLRRAQLEALRVAVPDDPNLAQFILDANDAATRSGIVFLSITPTPPSTAGATTATTAPGGAAGPVPIRLALTISGGYFQVLDFLNRLDRLPRIVVIDNLSLTGGSAAQLSVSITARMFVAAATASATSPAAGAAAATTTTVAGATTTTTPGATTSTAAAGATTSSTSRTGP